MLEPGLFPMAPRGPLRSAPTRGARRGASLERAAYLRAAVGNLGRPNQHPIPHDGDAAGLGPGVVAGVDGAAAPVPHEAGLGMGTAQPRDGGRKAMHAGFPLLQPLAHHGGVGEPERLARAGLDEDPGLGTNR